MIKFVKKNINKTIVRGFKQAEVEVTKEFERELCDQLGAVGLSPEEFERLSQQAQGIPEAIDEPLPEATQAELDFMMEMSGFIDQAVAISSPGMFAQAVSGNFWKLYPHLALLDEYIVRAINGEFPRLIVSMPPQHGKSVLISEHLPAWYLGHFPDNAVILASYETNYAKTYGRKSRELIERWGPSMFGIQVDRKTRTMDNWGIQDHRGIMQTAGAGGSITGKKANLLIIDDPVKNAADALSLVKRESNKDWFRTTSSTRLHEGGAIIIVQTRWHDDDLAGWLAREFPDIWKVVNLPAIAWAPNDLPEHERTPDPLNRKPGQALCPQLHSAKSLREKIRMMGPGWFSALYQGRPVAMGGGIIKTECFKYWSYGRPKDVDSNCTKTIQLPDSFDYIIQSWDMTFKDTKDSDWVVGQIWGVKGADRFLLAQFRDQIDFNKTVDAVRNLTASHFGRYSREKLIEVRANGPACISVLEKEIMGLTDVDPLGTGGKEARAHGISFQIESGHVYIPHPEQPGCEWVMDFLMECGSFPRGRHDDQVDAMTQALAYLFEKCGNMGIIASVTDSDVKKAFDILEEVKTLSSNQVRAVEAKMVEGFDRELKNLGSRLKLNLSGKKGKAVLNPRSILATINERPGVGGRKVMNLGRKLAGVLGGGVE